MFRIYILIGAFFALGLYWGSVPADFLNEILGGVEGRLFPFTPEVFKFTQDISNFYFMLTTITSIVAAFISLGTRDVFEVIALFFFGMLPKERKYWGVVFDEISGKPIAFIPVRIFKYEGEKPKLLASTVTDTDGRYRLQVSTRDKIETRYAIEISASGYEPFMQDIAEYLVIGNYELINDVPLKRAKSTANPIVRWFYYNRTRIYNWLFIFIYVEYIALLLLTIVFFINGPIFINYFGTITIGVSVIWNTYVVRHRIAPQIGKVIDSDGKQPLQSSLVTIYQNKGQSVAAITNEAGIVRVNMPAGMYKALASAQGYMMLSADAQGMAVIKVGRDGYIDRDILMKKAAGAEVPKDASLLNPFGN